MEDLQYLHQNQPNPTASAPSKIVEAFGLRKCPKLVEQCMSEELEVRQNALYVLCEEFRNPYSIYGCVQGGVVGILSSYVSDADFTTRLRSSFALAIAAEDANGLASILAENAVAKILTGLRDPSVDVRENIYRCFYHCTRTVDGLEAVVASGAVKVLLNSINKEGNEVRVVVLRTVHNFCRIEPGLRHCLEAKAVEKSIKLLESESDEVVADAAKALGFLAFSDKGKEDAIACNAVGAVVQLLKMTGVPSIRLAASNALMAVTTSDEGKKQMLPCDGESVVLSMLNSDSRALKLNGLKVVSNIAVYPPLRAKLLDEDAKCLPAIRMMVESTDNLIQKHARIALAAMLWEP